MTKKLTPTEFEKMERARLLLEFRDKESQLVAARLSLIDERQKVLQLMISNLVIERRDLQDEKEKVKQRRAEDKKNHELVLDAIKKRLKISGKFGYHPDTLEVIEEDGQ